MHGKSNTRLYTIFEGMKNRCYNSNTPKYKNYGGRGIRVCEEWLNDFMNFYNWAMENGYSDNLTIDRKDVDGDYCPTNCRWITDKEQRFNRTDTHYVTIKGVTKPITQWSKESGINHKTIALRIELGWNEEDLLNPTKETMKIEFKGEYYTFDELSEMYNIKRTTLYKRYRKGLRDDELISSLKKNQYK
jgi:hypothetical protein